MNQTRIDGSYQIDCKENEQIEVPGVGGGWGEIEGVCQLARIWLKDTEPGDRWQLLLSFRKMPGEAVDAVS